MKSFEVNLTNCDREPIHIPGAIQSFGFLVVLDFTTQLITHVSSNIKAYLGIEPGSILGVQLMAFERIINNGVSNTSLAAYVEQTKNKEEQEEFSFPIELAGKAFHLTPYQHNNSIYLEFEDQYDFSEIKLQQQIGRAVSEVLSQGDLDEKLNKASRQVKELTGYDRVMIYKFLEDGHGKVISEVKNEGEDSFFDLHYPASDIPVQARELYKLNKARIIANVQSETSSILTTSDSPLDLTYTSLRAVSPIHIEYLKNMKVASSFSVSIIVKGELWGLISCHNNTPKLIPRHYREAAKLLGQILSSAIEFQENEQLMKDEQVLKIALNGIIQCLRTEKDIVQAILNSKDSFLKLVNATGLVVVVEGRIVKEGLVPNENEIYSIVNWLSVNDERAIFSTDKLSQYIPLTEKLARIASGMLSCTISKELKEYVIWFRPEYLQSITWAGNPEKPVEVSSQGGYILSPRKSFENFRQLLKYTAIPWKQAEVNMAIELQEEIQYILTKQANEVRVINEKLKKAYEELDTFSSTISHDLRTPLAVIKSYSQIIERESTSIEDSRTFASRITAGIDKMNMLIKEVLEYSRVGRVEIDFKPIDMSELLNGIKEELFIALAPSNLDFRIGNTPEIPGERIMIYQVFLNLLNNAIKYSRLSNPSIVSINGVESDGDVTYSVSDNGIGINPKSFSKVFELFKRVNTSSEYEGTGVGLAIVKRIVEKHRGKIWIESEYGKGTTFFVKFSNGEKASHFESRED